MVKLKNWWERRKLSYKYKEEYMRKGFELLSKKREVYAQYLSANKRKDINQENYFKGQVQLLEWLLNEKIL
jgi:hypothetical protein